MVNFLNRLVVGGGVLIAAAVASSAIAADAIITPEIVESETKLYGGVRYLLWHELNDLPADEIRDQLESIKDVVIKSHVNFTKYAYARSAAVAYIKDHTGCTYAEAAAEYDRVIKELNPPKDYEQNLWYRNTRASIASGMYYRETSVEFRQECYNAYKGQFDLPEVGWIAQSIHLPYEEWSKYFQSTVGDKNQLVKASLNDHIDKVADLFFELLKTGNLWPEAGSQEYPKVLGYVLSKDDTDIPKLITTLKRAITVYKSQARNFKPAKEGDTNYALVLVGLMQDTISDLQ